MAKTITTEEVKQKIDSKEDLYLIDTLMANSYEMRHIPGAISIPFGTDFLEKFEEQVKASKDEEIIMYCASGGCQLSKMAADALEGAGYTNVGHYVDGLAGWQEAGYEFEGKTT